MSLRPDDRSGRSRSKSPGRERERSRSRSNVRSSKDDVKSPIYEERTPKTMAGAERAEYSSQWQNTASSYPPPPGAGSYPQDSSYSSYSSAPSSAPYPRQDDNWTMGDYKDLPPNERPGFIPPAGSFPGPPSRRGTEDGLAYGDPNSPVYSRSNSYESYPRSAHPPQAPYVPQPPSSSTYPYHNQDYTHDSRSSSYSQQYTQQPDHSNYGSNNSRDPYSAQHTPAPYDQFTERFSRSKSQSTHDRGPSVVERVPRDPHSTRSATQNRLSIDTRGSSGLAAQPSPGLTPRMNHLSVGGQQPHQPGELPPPSPLLEPYRGTYQAMSPMPFALRPNDDLDDLSDLEPLETPATKRKDHKKGVNFTQETKHEKEPGRRVKVYDPEEDAKTISKALGRSKVDSETISEIIATRSHDQIVYLKKEYKKQVKVQGKGVNLSKHLKTKLAGNFGKAIYVTALGRWESEGYWANFFYQSHNSRRELLVESLMGRTNSEIWNIKDEFKDKRYSDDLVKCMEKELKMDKFRTAVLLVLEERRQEEQDDYPVEYKNRDAATLHKALTAKQGGESTMLEIILLRSDSHLRDVLKIYEQTFQENFPRAALKKSNNLVGEVIAHILNGVINKPARDALLLRHAIEDVADKNKDEELRYELLISRLVRLHWDKVHLIRVKREYKAKYKTELEHDIEDAGKGDFIEFMSELCQTK